MARVGGGPDAVVGLASPLVGRFLDRIQERGALRKDITVEQATEWLVGVHLSLLGPVFPDQPRAHRAEMLRTFVAYALGHEPEGRAWCDGPGPSFRTKLTIVLIQMRMILMIEPMVRLRHASIGYDRRPVVIDVDLAVDAGEVVALLGPNGSGKSTMVRGMLGLARVMGGDVELFGQPVSGSGTAGGWATCLSARPARPDCRRRSRRWWPPAGCPACAPGSASGPRHRARVAAAIETVGLGGRERSPMLELSGGQQRRALIARALAAEADLLVLDEPTAGVDAASQVSLAATIDELAHGGATILYITHEPGPVSHLCSRAVELRAGRISYDGPIEDSAGAVGRSPPPRGAVGSRLVRDPLTWSSSTTTSWCGR